MIHKVKNEYIALLIFVTALCGSMAIIYTTFPNEADYYQQADEGIYYRQATKITEEGLSGYKILAKEFIENPALQVFPPPDRLAHILFASWALQISNSYTSLSLLSLLFFSLNCIVCFFFFRKFTDFVTAAAGGVLVCISPVTMGIARRALSDTDSAFFVTLSVFTFIYYLRERKRRDLFLFILFFSIAILMKESALFLLPFFGGIILYQKFVAGQAIRFINVVALLVLPILLVLALYVIAFGDTLLPLFETTNQIIRTTPHSYIVHFNSGPWYQYFVDYFLVSPVVSVSFFLFAGYYLLAGEKSFALNSLFLFFVYYICVFAFLPKNIRYALPLDVVYRLGTALFLLLLVNKLRTNQPTKKLVFATLMLLVVTSDLLAFNNFFVKNKVYDTISYNLLQAENFFSLKPEITQPETKPAQVQNDSALYFLNRSLQFYSNGQYEQCIAAAEEAIREQPDNSAAYNNICSAYNQLHNWDKAITAGKKAVELDPANQLARNNLNWAISQKEKQIR